MCSIDVITRPQIQLCRSPNRGMTVIAFLWGMGQQSIPIYTVGKEHPFPIVFQLFWCEQKSTTVHLTHPKPLHPMLGADGFKETPFGRISRH